MIRWLALVMAIFASSAAVAQTEIIIGADKPGGSYYLYGGGLSNWINEHSKTLRATSETTSGSVDNARLVTRGRITFGLINNSVLYNAYHGLDQFKGHADKNIRAVAILDTAYIHIVTLKSTGIKSVSDLAGKRVSIGPPGSGTASAMKAILAAAGLNGKVHEENLGYSAASSNLRDGDLDAFAVGSALPVPAVTDLASTRSVVLIPLSNSVMNKLHSELPAYRKAVIPGGTYPGIKNDVVAAANSSTLATSAQVPDSVVGEVVRLMFSKGALKYMHTVYRAWDPMSGYEVFKGIGVPLHPAAESYYRAHGMLK